MDCCLLCSLPTLLPPPPRGAVACLRRPPTPTTRPPVFSSLSARSLNAVYPGTLVGLFLNNRRNRKPVAEVRSNNNFEGQDNSSKVDEDSNGVAFQAQSENVLEMQNNLQQQAKEQPNDQNNSSISNLDIGEFDTSGSWIASDNFAQSTEAGSANDGGQVVSGLEGPDEQEEVPFEEKPGPLAGSNVMNVVVVAAECAPWSKTGGLGDVVGDLPKALARRGHRVMVVVPRYGKYAEAKEVGVRKRYKADGQDFEVTYYHAYIDCVDFVFIDAPVFWHIEDDIYSGSKREILKRMVLLCKAAVEVPWHVPCGGACYGDGNLVFLANDWHTALLPVYLKAYYRNAGLMTYARSVLVIHNISYQGRGPLDEYSCLDLTEEYKDLFDFYDPVGGQHLNILRAGLLSADRIVTVSHSYSWELRTSEGGWGLHGIINEIGWKFHGIVNGINPQIWNPKYDDFLTSDGYTNYDLETLQVGKAQCKAALQREFGLQVRGDVPIIAFIGRLDGQKGVELIAEAMHWFAGQDIQLIMLGTGRPDLQDMLRRFEREHNQKVRGWVGFSVKLAHRITAGADILLMPSRFEPCGLNQLYAMMYGTVPVVHAVGGLRDTVQPFDPCSETGLGWTFDRAEPHKMIDALGHCLRTYREYRESWEGIQARGMQMDFSWDKACHLLARAQLAINLCAPQCI